MLRRLDAGIKTMPTADADSRCALQSLRASRSLC
jgi:hypothetical protein